MSNAQAVYLKAKSVLRDRGYSDGDTSLEYKDWHIEIHSGLAYVSVWYSGAMVYLALAREPVFYRPGPWEQYLDRLFHRMDINGREREPVVSIDSLSSAPEGPEPSEDS